MSGFDTVRTNIIRTFTWRTFTWALAPLASISACSFLVPTDREPGKRAYGYHLSTPPTWKTRSADQSDHAFQLPSGNTVTVVSSCARNADAPPDVLTKHLLIGSRNIVIDKQEKVSVDGADGLHSAIRATFDGMPFFLEVMVIPKAGCVFDLSLISPKPIHPKESQEFERFAQTFRYSGATP